MLDILSLIVWALMLVVCVKFATFVLRADCEGEGGNLALLALLVPTSPSRRLEALAVRVPVPLGAAMLYGDGVITSALFVLSAVEGPTRQIAVAERAFDRGSPLLSSTHGCRSATIAAVKTSRGSNIRSTDDRRFIRSMCHWRRWSHA
jgi:hypothetical protein